VLSERAQEILIKATELARESGRTDLAELFETKLAEGCEDGDDGPMGPPVISDT
jgi:hypothetical protein